MVFIAAIALVLTPDAPPPPAHQVAAERQAIAMVRVLPGAQVRFLELEKSAPDRLTDTQIRSADGSVEPARLVEFQ